MSAESPFVAAPSPDLHGPKIRRFAIRGLFGNWSTIAGAAVLAFMLALAIMAPFLGTVDPTEINPAFRNRMPGSERTIRGPGGETTVFEYRMGTDSLGRDIYSRVIYGTRVSLMVGSSVAVCSLFVGLIIGLFAGYYRWIDAVVMRLMDGLMAIPGVLLAIGLVAVFRGSVSGVIISIAVPEVPRVVRLVRAIVLSVRSEPYVEAAITAGTPTPRLILRHILPNAVPPLIVQGTFIAAVAILVEAILSFLGIGISPEIPSWGNIMAEGRNFFRLYPQNIFFPGMCLGLTVLAVNMLGDSLRDGLDPKLARRV